MTETAAAARPATRTIIVRPRVAERHGGRGLLERGMVHRRGERRRARPACDVDEAEVGGPDAAVKARAEVARLPAEQIARAAPSGHEPLVLMARDLEGVDEDDSVGVVARAFLRDDVVQARMSGKRHLAAWERRVGDGAPTGSGRGP